VTSSDEEEQLQLLTRFSETQISKAFGNWAIQHVFERPLSTLQP